MNFKDHLRHNIQLRKDTNSESISELLKEQTDTAKKALNAFLAAYPDTPHDARHRFVQCLVHYVTYTTLHSLTNMCYALDEQEKARVIKEMLEKNNVSCTFDGENRIHIDAPDEKQEGIIREIQHEIKNN